MITQRDKLMAEVFCRGEHTPVTDMEEYRQLVVELHLADDAMQRFEIWQQIEIIKNRHGGMPPC